MAKKRNKVSFEVMNPSLKNVDSDANLEILNQASEKVKVVEKSVKPAILISRANYPIELRYDGEGLMLSPRERVKILDLEKLAKDNLDPKVVIKKL